MLLFITTRQGWALRFPFYSKAKKKKIASYNSINHDQFGAHVSSSINKTKILHMNKRRHTHDTIQWR